MELRESPWTSSKGEYAPASLKIVGSHVEFARLRRFGGGEDVAVRYDRIAHVAVAPGFRYARLVVETTGGGGFTIDGLRQGDAAKAKTLIEKLAAKQPRSTPTTAVQTGSLAEELAQLADLHKQGVLT